MRKNPKTMSKDDLSSSLVEIKVEDLIAEGGDVVTSSKTPTKTPLPNREPFVEFLNHRIKAIFKATSSGTPISDSGSTPSENLVSDMPFLKDLGYNTEWSRRTRKVQSPASPTSKLGSGSRKKGRNGESKPTEPQVVIKLADYLLPNKTHTIPQGHGGDLVLQHEFTLREVAYTKENESLDREWVKMVGRGFLDILVKHIVHHDVKISRVAKHVSPISTPLENPMKHALGASVSDYMKFRCSEVEKEIRNGGSERLLRLGLLNRELWRDDYLIFLAFSHLICKNTSRGGGGVSGGDKISRQSHAAYMAMCGKCGIDVKKYDSCAVLGYICVMEILEGRRPPASGSRSKRFFEAITYMWEGIVKDLFLRMALLTDARIFLLCHKKGSGESRNEAPSPLKAFSLEPGRIFENDSNEKFPSVGDHEHMSLNLKRTLDILDTVLVGIDSKSPKPNKTVVPRTEALFWERLALASKIVRVYEEVPETLQEDLKRVKATTAVMFWYKLLCAEPVSLPIPGRQYYGCYGSKDTARGYLHFPLVRTFTLGSEQTSKGDLASVFESILPSQYNIEGLEKYITANQVERKDAKGTARPSRTNNYVTRLHDYKCIRGLAALGSALQGGSFGSSDTGTIESCQGCDLESNTEGQPKNDLHLGTLHLKSDDIGHPNAIRTYLQLQLEMSKRQALHATELRQRDVPAPVSGAPVLQIECLSSSSSQDEEGSDFKSSSASDDDEEDEDDEDGDFDPKAHDRGYDSSDHVIPEDEVVPDRDMPKKYIHSEGDEILFAVSNPFKISRERDLKVLDSKSKIYSSSESVSEDSDDDCSGKDEDSSELCKALQDNSPEAVRERQFADKMLRERLSEGVIKTKSGRSVRKSVDALRSVCSEELYKETVIYNNNKRIPKRSVQAVMTPKETRGKEKGNRTEPEITKGGGSKKQSTRKRGEKRPAPSSSGGLTFQLVSFSNGQSTMTILPADGDVDQTPIPVVRKKRRVTQAVV